jgi:hypothetical protein
MKTEYAEWIKVKLSESKPLGKCSEWTEEMQAVFPELKRVRGHAFLSSGYERAHWWLTTETGEIIDPTVSQFTDPEGLFNAQVAFYDPWTEGEVEPTGKCPNCGGLCYEEKYLCSPACEVAYVAYCNNPMRL